MSLLSEIRKPIEQELAHFQETFDQSLTSSNPLLMGAIGHIRKRNGKMMRPLLVLLFAKLYGSVSKEAIHSAASLELLHTASLVHDDVVDESDQRRGQLSVNALFNNKVSVLVGDFLLATSLVQVSLSRDYRIIDVVAKLGQQLADGEILQLSNITNQEFSEEVYFNVIYKKTAALFAACTRVASLSAGSSEQDIEAATLFGEYLGICFQIRDDIFDYSDSSDIGKPTGNDMLEGKLTLPSLYVLNNGADAKTTELAYRIKSGDASTQEIEQFIDTVIAGGGIEYAENIMLSYRQKALDIISGFPDNAARKSLISYLDYVVLRKK